MNTGSPEIKNTNNNEGSINSTGNCVNSEDSTIGIQHNTNFVKNSKENCNVPKISKDNYSQKMVFGIDKNMSSAIGNNSNILSNKELFSNESDDNVQSNILREDKCLKRQQKGSPQVSKETDNLLFPKGNITNGETKSENKSLLNNECLPSVASQGDKCGDTSVEVRLNKPQILSSNLNIIPNPNEFNLVGKSNISPENIDFLNVNQCNNEVMALSDNSIVISNSNAIPQSDSIVSSNYSLSQLQVYVSDDDDSVVEESPVTPLQYRGGDQQMEDSDDSDSSTSSSTSILISDSSSDSESEDEYENFSNKPICKPVKAKGEMDLGDLPPIEDLTISVPEEECIPVGKVYQIVDQLVIVQANKDTPAYDLDTVLFTQGGKPLGKVFDVMGPVTEPYYCVRFNSKDHIKERNITLDQTVYAAPKTQYSKFVFLAQLMQLKGSDASWENDQEPPEIFLDYSDDEQEQRAKKKFYRNKKAVYKTDSDPDEPARKRHSAYVKRMNARNLRLSAVRGNPNPIKNKAENGNILWQSNLPPMMGASPPPPRAFAPCHQMFGRPPLFDMRVPPPSSSFINPGGMQFHRAESLAYPHIFTGPSTSRPQGPSPFSRPSVSPGPPPFARPCASPGPPPFARLCASPAPVPFARACTSPGPPPFPRPCASPGSSNGPRMSPFTPPPPYCQLPNKQAFNSTPPGWNPSFPKSDNPWTNPIPPPPPRNGPALRNAPPVGSFPLPMDFQNRANPPRGPQFITLPPWSVQAINQENSLQFNPNVPPPSPNFFQN